MIKKLGIFMLTAALAACDGSPTLLGNWTQPIPGMDGVQGIALTSDGVAKSINMATLQYQTWQRDGDKLILSGKSIGNHQTIDFTDVMTIENLTHDTLILNNDGETITYHRTDN